MPGNDHMGHMASTHDAPILNIALFVWISVFLRQGPIWLRLDLYLVKACFELPILLILSISQMLRAQACATIPGLYLKVSSHLTVTKSLGWGVNRIRSFLQMRKLRPKHFLERGRIGDSFWPKQGLFSLCFAKERSLCSNDRRGQCSQGQFIPPMALRRGQTPELLARRLVGHIRSVRRPSPGPSTPPTLVSECHSPPSAGGAYL